MLKVKNKLIQRFGLQTYHFNSKNYILRLIKLLNKVYTFERKEFPQMNEYTHLKKIDAVLSALNNKHKEETQRLKPNVTIEGVYTALSDWGANLKPSEINQKIAFDKIMPNMLEYQELCLILKYLNEENMIYEIRNQEPLIQNTYGIEYKGRIIIENGGYYQKKIDDLNAYENERKAEKRLTDWTAFAAGGAVGLLLWELWKWFFPRHEDFLCTAKNMLLYFF